MPSPGSGLSSTSLKAHMERGGTFREKLRILLEKRKIDAEKNKGPGPLSITFSATHPQTPSSCFSRNLAGHGFTAKACCQEKVPQCLSTWETVEAPPFQRSDALPEDTLEK